MACKNIHNFYRVWFTSVDPLLLAFLTYTLVFTPDVMMDSLIPTSMSVPNPDHAFLFHQLAALYGFLTLMLAVLLRSTSDLKVWNIVIGAVLMIDVALLTSLYVSLDHQGRLGLVHWRAQDWFNWIITGFVAVVRVIFLAGVGVSKNEPSKDDTFSTPMSYYKGAMRRLSVVDVCERNWRLKPAGTSA